MGPGWTVHLAAGGPVYTGADGRWLRVRARQRPIVAIGELVARAAADLGDALVAVGPEELVVTAEGEYAALTTLAAVVDGAPCDRVVAAVYGDESYTLVEALVPKGVAVRDLVAGVRLGLGELRRRAFLCVAPPWPSTAIGALTEYLHDDGSRVLLFPARPLAFPVDPFEACHVDVAGLEHTADRPLVTDHLRGGLAHFSGGGRVVDLVTLTDGRYEYVLRLACAATVYAERARDLVAVLRSIRPLPLAAAAQRSAADALAQWC